MEGFYSKYKAVVLKKGNWKFRWEIGLFSSLDKMKIIYVNFEWQF